MTENRSDNEKEIKETKVNVVFAAGQNFTITGFTLTDGNA